MFKRLSIHVALIFLFAFAQIGAVTHEISHVEDLVKHSQQDSNKQDQSKQDHSNQDKNTHSELCAQCISFAKIASGLATQGFVLATPEISFVASSQLSTQPSSQPHSAYAARAPPYLG